MTSSCARCLSERTERGARIARFSADLKEFGEHLGVKKAHYVGWSMGAAVLWGYIDLFGTKGINKLVLIDEPPSIYRHADWSEKERLDAGGMTSSPERMVEAFTTGKPVSSLAADALESARRNLSL
ncbi:alpha/beta fold hydrolase [Massilia sp. TWR1-2-2]|uniref:alpha/beta fold hydrolase n=1 Tax=Massilia sp. TWR1-2-2 TaxID=2804584 RepID=UPI003CFB59F9